MRNCLSSSKALLASGVQVNFLEALSSLKKGKPFSPNQDMKWLKAAMHPVSFWTSFTLVGGFILVTASIFSRFAMMPRLLTIVPKSIPKGTPNTHLVGFSFHWNFLRF